MIDHGLHADELDRVFPFHLAIDRELRVLHFGHSLGKLLPELAVGADVTALFALERPHAALAYEVLRDRCATHCILVSRTRAVSLKGQILSRAETDRLLFLGSPRLTNATELTAVGLTINDFAVHDPIIDFLFLSHAQQSALAEVQAMAERLTEQRAEVREAHNRLTTLYVASRVLAEYTNLEVALQVLIPALAKTLGCASASAWFSSGGELRCQVAYPETQPRALRLGGSCGLIAGVFMTNEPMWLPAGFGVEDGILSSEASAAVTSRSDASDPIDPPTLRYAEGARSLDRAVCGLPIRSGNVVVGVIAFAMPTTIQRPEDLLYLLGEITSKLEHYTGQLVAAQQLAAARDAALASVRAKSAFLANVSHEIRTPLGAVIGLASVLRGMRLHAPADEVIDDIHDAGTTLLRLVDDLLDESRIEAGKVSIETRPFDLIELLRSTVAPLQIKAAARGLPLILEIDPALPGNVIGDRVRIGQVVANLIGNAVKFTELGSVRVRAHGVDDGPAATVVTIAVADTGLGIAADQLDRIFEPFSQVDESTTRKFGGAGLGLSIARRLLALMGGTLAVASTPGRGSTFTVTLRMERAQASEIHADRVRRRSDSGSPLPTSQRRHILLVEDNPLGQRATKMMLEQLGHRVDVVEDGITAIVAVERNRYDLVLMDCHLPGLDGFEATRRIRALPGTTGRIPIVACTASVLAVERQRCIDVGMNDVLNKPLSFDSLRQVTESLASRPVSSPASRDGALLDVKRIAMLRSLADAQGRQSLGQMVAMYCVHAPVHLSSMEAATISGDADALRRAAHALHGMSLNVGAAAVARACAAVEHAAVAGRITPIDDVRASYQETLTALTADQPGSVHRAN